MQGRPFLIAALIALAAPACGSSSAPAPARGDDPSVAPSDRVITVSLRDVTAGRFRDQVAVADGVLAAVGNAVASINTAGTARVIRRYRDQVLTIAVDGGQPAGVLLMRGHRLMYRQWGAAGSVTLTKRWAVDEVGRCAAAVGPTDVFLSYADTQGQAHVIKVPRSGGEPVEIASSVSRNRACLVSRDGVVLAADPTGELRAISGNSDFRSPPRFEEFEDLCVGSSSAALVGVTAMPRGGVVLARVDDGLKARVSRSRRWTSCAYVNDDLWAVVTTKANFPSTTAAIVRLDANWRTVARREFSSGDSPRLASLVATGGRLWASWDGSRAILIIPPPAPD